MNFKKLFFAIIALFLVTVESCQKEDPQPFNPATAGSSSNFVIQGTIDGKPINISAGSDNYFMATSYELDSNGVYDFIGVLRPRLCTGKCANSLKIAIKDYQLASLSSNVAVDSSIIPGYYAFASPNGTQTQFNSVFIGGLSNGTAIKYTWDFGDGKTEESIAPTAFHKYERPGVYNVMLGVQSLEGCESTISNQVVVGATGNTFIPQINTTPNGDTILFLPFPLGTEYTYDWNFGDGTTSSEIAPSHKYTQSGVYKVSLTVTDKNGVSGTTNSNIATKDAKVCSSYFIAPSVTAVSNPLNLAGVVVEWTDANGTTWSSKTNNQSSSGSVFKIVSVENYLTNQDGIATKKIKVNFSCTLFNGSRSVEVQNVKATFCVGVK